jgi:hypothetical protein
LRKLLVIRTGLDANRQGNELRRNVYRCADWFTYLLYGRGDSPFADDQKWLNMLQERIFEHLMRTGTDAPSETTVCILMNGYPELPIPAHLMREYGPIHRERPEGESR